MFTNKVLRVLLFPTMIIVVPLQFVTTFVLGLLVNLTFGLLLIPISAIWLVVFFAPLFCGSWLGHRFPFLRNVIGILLLPIAVLANAYAAMMPSMGELENRATKLLTSETWPFTWEFVQFQRGKIELNPYPNPMSPEAWDLMEIFTRTGAWGANGDPLRSRTIAKLMLRELLDSGVGTESAPEDSAAAAIDGLIVAEAEAFAAYEAAEAEAFAAIAIRKAAFAAVEALQAETGTRISALEALDARHDATDDKAIAAESTAIEALQAEIVARLEAVDSLEAATDATVDAQDAASARYRATADAVAVARRRFLQ